MNFSYQGDRYAIFLSKDELVELFEIMAIGSAQLPNNLIDKFRKEMKDYAIRGSEPYDPDLYDCGVGNPR
jgi:hypothetical protein